MIVVVLLVVLEITRRRVVEGFKIERRKLHKMSHSESSLCVHFVITYRIIIAGECMIEVYIEVAYVGNYPDLRM
jgi:hypothetical protein